MIMDSFWNLTLASLAAAVGFATATYGAWNGLRSAKGDARRRRIVRWALGFFDVVVAHCTVQILAPPTRCWIGWGGYGPALAVCVLSCNCDLGRFRIARRPPDQLGTSQLPPGAS